MPKSPHKQRYEDVFLKQLTEARKQAGLTQAAAASKLSAAGKLSATQSFVSKVEVGERRLDVVDLIDFLQVYAVSPASFVTELCNRLEQPMPGESSQGRRSKRARR